MKYLHYVTDRTSLTTTLDKVLHLSTLLAADQARFERETGLTSARIHLLWVLGLHGPSTQQVLASALEVTPRNVTGLVDGLVASGHVTRQPHPSDRRATLVTPTASGARAIRDLRESHADLAQQLFADVPASRLAAFDATLDETIATVTRLMKDHA
ncbi:DNA-binding MarR family transcriptional regulator [Mumia flava]|uniref:DNA-binding MarR family transcriptional regulator n=1 Tax=Mumia flava TaxID=1348852 RepID=A0A2M9BE51_9ACTN|nr:DNA-binding MarR family transcriptional regulator [Mumia flava]